MNIEEIIAKLKEAGKSDEEIRAALGELKESICAFLGEQATPPEEEHHPEEEDEEKMHEVFGI